MSNQPFGNNGGYQPQNQFPIQGNNPYGMNQFGGLPPQNMMNPGGHNGPKMRGEMLAKNANKILIIGLICAAIGIYLAFNREVQPQDEVLINLLFDAPSWDVRKELLLESFKVGALGKLIGFALTLYGTNLTLKGITGKKNLIKG